MVLWSHKNCNHILDGVKILLQSLVIGANRQIKNGWVFASHLLVCSKRKIQKILRGQEGAHSPLER